MTQGLLSFLELLSQLCHESSEIFFFGRVTESENRLSGCMVNGSAFLETFRVNGYAAENKVAERTRQWTV